MILPRNNKIRVLIVDDSSFMRMAIRRVLDRDPEIEVVGSPLTAPTEYARPWS